MLDRLDWTERLTLATLVVFAITLAVTAFASNPVVWLVWAAAMVVLAGTVLAAVNRADSPASE